MKIQQTMIQCLDETTHPVITRHFTSPDAYTGFQSQDLIDFLEARIQAALIYIALEQKRIEHHPDQIKIQPILDKKKQHLQTLQRQISVHFKSKQVENIFETLKKSYNYPPSYQTCFESLTYLAAQYFNTICSIARPTKPLKETTEELNRITALLKSNQKRPIQHHVYSVSDQQITDIHIPVGHFTQNQRALMKLNGQYFPHSLRTMSSKIRDHSQYSACNLLQSQLRMNGKTIFKGYRHGSQSTLLIENKKVRRFYSMENLKQILSAMIKDQISTGSLPTTDVIDLPITFISLLSPLGYLDYFDDTKQHRQISDVKFLVRSAHRRVFDLTIEGKVYHIRPDFTYFNLGVNVVRGLRDSALEQAINHRGMTEYVIHFIDWMKKAEHPSTIQQLVWTIEKSLFYQKFIQVQTQFERDTRPKLSQAYQDLEALYEQYLLFSHSNIIATLYCHGDILIQLERSIEEKKAEIETYEKIQDEAYLTFYESFKVYFKENQSTIDDLVYQLKDEKPHQKQFLMWTLFVDSLISYFGTPKGAHGFLSSRVSPWAKMLHEKSLFHWGISEYIQESAESYDNYNYQFQMRALALSYLMGQNVEWCCKSGEDRTGLMNDFMSALMIFIEIYQVSPRLNSPIDQQAFHDIFRVVQNCSPQKWSNAGNSPGERGKKVSSGDLKFLPPRLQQCIEYEKEVGRLQIILTDLASKVSPIPINHTYANSKTPQATTESHRFPPLPEDIKSLLSTILSSEDKDALAAFQTAEEVFYVRNYQRTFPSETQTSSTQTQESKNEFKP